MKADNQVLTDSKAFESVNAQSRMDFINKLNIALKEANETEYWLELLHESDSSYSDQNYQNDQNCR